MLFRSYFKASIWRVVYEVTEEDGFNTGYNFITQDVDEAIIELNRLMSRIDQSVTDF